MLKIEDKFKLKTYNSKKERIMLNRGGSIKDTRVLIININIMQ